MPGTPRKRRTGRRKTAPPSVEIAKFPAFPHRIAAARYESDGQGGVLPRANRPCSLSSSGLPVDRGASERASDGVDDLLRIRADTLLLVNDLAVAIEHG